MLNRLWSSPAPTLEIDEPTAHHPEDRPTSDPDRSRPADPSWRGPGGRRERVVQETRRSGEPAVPALRRQHPVQLGNLCAAGDLHTDVRAAVHDADLER